MPPGWELCYLQNARKDCWFHTFTSQTCTVSIFETSMPEILNASRYYTCVLKQKTSWLLDVPCLWFPQWICPVSILFFIIWVLMVQTHVTLSHVLWKGFFTYSVMGLLAKTRFWEILLCGNSPEGLLGFWENKQSNLLKMGVGKLFYSNSALPVWLSLQIKTESMK